MAQAKTEVVKPLNEVAIADINRTYALLFIDSLW